MEHKISYKLGLDPREASGFRGIPVTLEVLRKLLSGPACYSACLFTDGYRKEENFLGSSLVILDIDDGLTIDDALVKLEAFGDIRYVVAPSKSHQKEKRGVVRDRFRVVLFLDELVEDLEDYKLIQWYFLDMFGGDSATGDGARFYFGNPGISEGDMYVAWGEGTSELSASSTLKFAAHSKGKKDKTRSVLGGIRNPRANRVNRYTGGSGDPDNLWVKMASMDNMFMLEKLSGDPLVKGETFTFRSRGEGKGYHILVNGEPCDAWIDGSGLIGSGKGKNGGPSWIQWLSYYGNDKATIARWFKDLDLL